MTAINKFEKWNKYDITLLIVAYNEIKSGNRDSHEVISELSVALRKKFALLGCDIADNFRNNAGIRWQMSYIINSLEGTGENNARTPRNFIEMARIFNADTAKFEEIYIIAKRIIFCGNINKITFYDWLLEQNNLRVSLSEVYDYLEIFNTIFLNKFNYNFWDISSKEQIDDACLLLDDEASFSNLNLDKFAELRMCVNYFFNFIKYPYENNRQEKKAVKRSTIDDEYFTSASSNTCIFSGNINWNSLSNSDFDWLISNDIINKQLLSPSKYLTFCISSCENDSIISIESNFVDLCQIINNYFLYYDIFEFNNHTQLVSFKGKDLLNYIANNHFCVDNIDKHIINKKNSINLKGDSDMLAVLYYSIMEFCNPIWDRIYKEELQNIIRNRINCIPDEFLNCSIKKIVDQTDIVENIRKYGFIRLKDFKSKNIYDMCLSTCVHLLKLICCTHFALPKNLINAWINTLSPAEEEIIALRYTGDVKYTLEEVGNKFGLTRERIRQVESKALRKLYAEKNLHYINSIIYNLYLLSETDSFIDSSKYIGDSIRLLTREKFLNELENFDYYFDDNESLSLVELVFDELPEYFLLDEMDDMINQIYIDLDSVYSISEIRKLIGKYYSFHQFCYIKGKITTEIVLSLILKQYFPNGINAYDKKDLDVLRRKAALCFPGFISVDTDHNLQSKIMRYCSLVDRGIYVIKDNPIVICSELMEEIQSYIEDFPTAIVPFKNILAEFNDALVSIGIKNQYQLSTAVKSNEKFRYRTKKGYVFKTDNFLVDEIISYMQNSQLHITRNDLKKAFPGVTENTIIQAMNTPEIINMQDYFVLLSKLHISDEEKQTLKFKMDNVLCDDVPHNSKQIFAILKDTMQGLFLRIGITKYTHFFALCKSLFNNEFEFQRPFIANKGIVIDCADDQITKKMMEYETVTITDIKNISQDIGFNIGSYIDFINERSDEFIFKDKDTLIQVSLLDIDDLEFSRLDEILTEFIGDRNYLSLSTFYSYWKLPTLNIEWNMWVLYSIINLYSAKYEAVMSDSVLANASPVLIKTGYMMSESDMAECIIAEDDNLDLIDILDYDDLM